MLKEPRNEGIMKFMVEMLWNIPCYLWLSFNMGASCPESAALIRTKGNKGVLIFVGV